MDRAIYFNNVGAHRAMDLGFRDWMGLHGLCRDKKDFHDSNNGESSGKANAMNGDKQKTRLYDGLKGARVLWC